MRILVCGGRNFMNQELVDRILFEVTQLDNQYTMGTIIHGNARGADTFGALWGYRMGWKVEPYGAEWRKYGKAAGPIRNKQMLDEGKPDLVIAFPGGKGTANMVQLAHKAGVPVRVIEDN